MKKDGDGNSNLIQLEGRRTPQRPKETGAEKQQKVQAFRSFTGQIERIISAWSVGSRRAAMNDVEHKGTESAAVDVLVDDVWDALDMSKGPCGLYRIMQDDSRFSGTRLTDIMMLLMQTIQENAPANEELFNGLLRLCKASVKVGAPTDVKMQIFQSLIVVPGADLDELAKVCVLVNRNRDTNDVFGVGSGVWGNLITFSEEHYLQFSQAVAKKIRELDSDDPEVKEAAEKWIHGMETLKEELPGTIYLLQRHVGHIKTTIVESREHLKKKDKDDFWRGIVERDMGWMHISVDKMDEGEAAVDAHLLELKKLAEKYPYDATADIEAARKQWEHIDDGW